jgi:predicted nucleotide-binding protein
MHALIVEDDTYYSQLVSEWLEDLGFDVNRAFTLQDALLESANDLYNVFIIDLMLPNDPSLSGVSIEESRGGFLAGLALAKRVRRQCSNRPIVLLTGTRPDSTVWEWAAEHNVSIVDKFDGESALLSAFERAGVLTNPTTPRAFIVHGRDETTLEDVRTYIVNVLRWQAPFVLREQPSLGKTVIEKFEESALRVDCVFVLLTPDDTVSGPAVSDTKRRSRQNVIFELGFFYAHFGRRSGRVFLLHKGDVEIPSDIHGIVWVDITNGVLSAHEQIAREVSHLAGIRPPVGI